jgi:hypothetical protein
MSNIQTHTDQTFRTEMKEALKGGICTVVFTKSDGTEREMRCTLKQELLPKEAFKTPEANQAQSVAAPKQRKPKPDSNLSVWDLDKNAWRSFNLPTVTKWKREY